MSAAVEEWTRRLVNLDGRNRMLYFRELARGTLEITPDKARVHSGALDALLAGDPIRLDQLFAPEAVSDAALRVLALAAKARSNFEEKGLATLYVGHSFASWTRSDGRTPWAPIVMIPLRITLAGAGGEDARLMVSGPAEPNPSFVHAMRQDLGRDPYPDADVRSDDFREWLPAVAAACHDVEGFTTDYRLFIANLEFSKLPMVIDMEQNIDVLIDNDLVAAVAGDEAARYRLWTRLALSPDLPDEIPPAEEFLVCDADASQNLAITTALRGQSLVMHGPPGTGKSQTIANLISSLAAAGKTVLFVAEKRAAIGAVTRRLDAAGCGGLVLDLHDGSSRRQVAADLRESIESLSSWAAYAGVTPHDELATRRRRLVDHRHQMHQPRPPHGLSFFDLQAMVGTPDQEITGIRLSSETLDMWDEDGRAAVRAHLERYQLMARRLDQDPTGLWASSSVLSAEDAAIAKDAIERLAGESLPAVRDAYQACLAELGLPADTDVPVGEFTSLLGTVEKYFDGQQESFIEKAARLAADLAPARMSRLNRLVASLTNRAYRRAKQEVARSRETADPVAALEAAERISDAQVQWKAWFGIAPIPRGLESVPGLQAAFARYAVDRAELVKRIPAVAGVGGFRREGDVVSALSGRSDLAEARVELARESAALGEFGLGPVLRLVRTEDREQLIETAFRVFAASAIDAITWHEPELAMFHGDVHQQVSRRYLELDRRHMETTAHRVMKKVADRAIAVMADEPRETALVEHEVAERAHLMPIRRLLASAPHVVGALRPCWAMSPLLVSQLLEAAPAMFDVVIFDEASQVLPVHAIPSIARGSQVVVAGDPEQLPPSEFFASDSLEDRADGFEDEPADPLVDAESILDVMRELLAECDLQWHYRSQDERLINFSNAHIYDHSLVTFPATNRGTGLRHEIVHGNPATDEGTASNPDVARRVVDLILEHAAARPDESLGVIATSVRHANDISSALRTARLDSGDDFGGFFAEKGAEPFFIKIMTAAQGDERDHIIFSIGYGRNSAGELVYRWGALSRRGGERRLNVAVTRSKRRMTVVSAMGAAEIDPERTRAHGARLLRDYLEYAEHGGDAMERPDTAPLTAFEISVRDRLNAAGIPLEPHYGGGRLRIDFAAFDGPNTRQPVLAIETDGTGYNSLATARDRDRLRPEVLKKQGWRHHRLWSIDWFRDPETETAKIKEAWESAVQEWRDPSLRRIDEAPADRPVVAGRGRSPIAVRRTGILGYQRDELVQLVHWIESDGIDRTEDELMREMMDVLGFGSSRGRVGVALRGAIEEARR